MLPADCSMQQEAWDFRAECRRCRRFFLFCPGGIIQCDLQQQAALVFFRVVQHLLQAVAENFPDFFPSGDSGLNQVISGKRHGFQADTVLAEKNILVKGEMESGEDSGPRITLHCPGEVTGTPSPEGMEVRFTLEFWMDTGKRLQKLCIADASVEEPEPSAQRQPSVILRKFDRSGRLWDIAKQYRTTCADILSANQVESEQAILADKLLLIPRRKV